MMTDTVRENQSILPLQVRIDELEIRVAFLDELVESLNRVVAQQDLQLTQLQQQFQLLYRRVDQSLSQQDGVEPFDVLHDIPPHY
jgi:SlyX protein